MFLKYKDKTGFTKPVSITLKCNEDEDIGHVVSSEESQGTFQEITKISKETTEITLIGHSSNYVLKKDRNLSSLDPKALANKINNMYTGDKTKSIHIRLVSCEVGLVVNGRSFAQNFLQEMQALGFTNLKVHAFNPPELEPPATGMIVSTSINDTLVDSWVYRRASQEIKDAQISSSLEKLDEEYQDKTNQEYINKRNDLLDKQSKLRLYICGITKTSDALGLEQNTFKGQNQTAKAIMSLDVALAITSLRYQRMKTSKSENADLCTYLDTCLDKLQKNPTIKQNEISTLLAKETSVLAINTTPYIKAITEVMKFINENRTLPPEASITNSSKTAWQFIKSFFEIFVYTCFKGAAPEEFKNRLDIVKNNLINSRVQPESHQLKQEANNSFNDLKVFLLTQIQEYLDNNENPKDKMHINKRAVMIELKNILNEPKLEIAKQNLSKLNAQITSDKYKFWNKGLASKVAATKLEIEEYIEQKNIFKP